MKVAISQPTFLPWPGYFFLINEVDEFVFLDNVQFNKRSWQQRNYLSNDGQKILISVPVKSKGKYDQLIKDVKIDDENFNIKKLLNKIMYLYKNHPFFDNFYSDLEKIFNKKHSMLRELNIDLIKYICKVLNINTNLSLSSDLVVDGNLKKIELLKQICIQKKASKYISTYGSKVYLGDIKKFSNTKIDISYFYSKEEDSNIKLSILDFLFKNGTECFQSLKDKFVRTEP